MGLKCSKEGQRSWRRWRRVKVVESIDCRFWSNQTIIHIFGISVDVFRLLSMFTHTYARHNRVLTSHGYSNDLVLRKEKIPCKWSGILRIHSPSNNTQEKSSRCHTFGVSTEDVQMRKWLLPGSSLWSRRNTGQACKQESRSSLHYPGTSQIYSAVEALSHNVALSHSCC